MLRIGTMQLKIDRRGLRDESGTTLVEFAIIILLLVTLVTFIAEGGLFFGAWLAVTNGAREGARYGATCVNRYTVSQTTPDCSDANVRALVRNITSGFLDQDNFVVTATHTPGSYSSNVWVYGEVTVIVSATVPAVGPLLGDLPVSARSVMRSEY